MLSKHSTSEKLMFKVSYHGLDWITGVRHPKFIVRVLPRTHASDRCSDFNYLHVLLFLQPQDTQCLRSTRIALKH